MGEQVHFGVVTYFAVKLLSWNHNSNISIIFGYWVECPVKWLGYRERGKDCWKMWSWYLSKLISQVCSAIAKPGAVGDVRICRGLSIWSVWGSTICSDGSSLVQIVAYWSGGKISVTTIFFVCLFTLVYQSTTLFENDLPSRVKIGSEGPLLPDRLLCASLIGLLVCCYWMTRAHTSVNFQWLYTYCQVGLTL